MLDLGQQWLTSAQAAEFIGVSIRYLDRLQRLGKLTPSRIGRSRIWSHQELADYRDNHPRLGTLRTSA